MHRSQHRTARAPLSEFAEMLNSTLHYNAAYYLAFPQTLKEVHERFDAEIYAYCLMGNYYHLLMGTPRANLDRIIRHINDMYTQRCNRLKHTEGPLFRGRYKSILVDKGATCYSWVGTSIKIRLKLRVRRIKNWIKYHGLVI